MPSTTTVSTQEQPRSARPAAVDDSTTETAGDDLNVGIIAGAAAMLVLIIATTAYLMSSKKKGGNEQPRLDSDSVYSVHETASISSANFAYDDRAATPNYYYY